MQHRDLLHLYHRTSFGMDMKVYTQLRSQSRKEVVEGIFRSNADYEPLSIDLTELSEYFKEALKKNYKDYSPEEKKKIGKIGREKLKDLNLAWIDRLSYSKNSFREKMTLFWANLFVCRDHQVWFAQKYNNTLRKHALGHFGEFVKAIAKEPSMSKYLNNNQNFKDNPNENFARELMELFTLGVGHYTEQDIKEAARAFTGWSFRRDGTFFLRTFRHDFGKKKFLNQEGNFNGDDIIDIILEQKQCAQFICEKIYRYFVNPIIDVSHISEMVNVFYKNYDIEKLMHHIFMADWFYDKKNVGVKIKSPIELLVGMRRVVPFTFQNPKQLVYIQRIMGQFLLYPPNVAGWKGDRTWIDSNTLLFRMKLSSVLLNDAVITLAEKGAFEDSFEKYYQRAQQKKTFFKTTKNWDSFYEAYAAVSTSDLSKYLLVSKLDLDTKKMVSKLSLKDKRNHCIQLMSLPEYQLC